MFTFSTVDLEAALMRCNNVLTTYTDPATKKWDTRMSNLTMKWDSSRKCLLEAVLSCEGLPSPNICPHCCEGKVLIRCSDCPKRFYCPSCDRKVHSSLPFHGREGFVNGFFEAIPPTITIGENGLKKDVGKLLKICFWLKKSWWTVHSHSGVCQRSITMYTELSIPLTNLFFASF